MRRFTTEPLTETDLRECYGRLWMSLGKKLILILRPLEFEHPTSTTVSFPKDPSVRYCAGSCWMTYSWKDLNRNISKNNTIKKY
jgi:hypothetical protein